MHPILANIHLTLNNMHPTLTDMHPALTDHHLAPADMHPTPTDMHPAVTNMHPAPANLHPAITNLHPAVTNMHPTPIKLNPASIQHARKFTQQYSIIVKTYTRHIPQKITKHPTKSPPSPIFVTITSHTSAGCLARITRKNETHADTDRKIDSHRWR